MTLNRYSRPRLTSGVGNASRLAAGRASKSYASLPQARVRRDALLTAPSAKIKLAKSGIPYHYGMVLI